MFHYMRIYFISFHKFCVSVRIRDKLLEHCQDFVVTILCVPALNAEDWTLM